MSHESKSYTPSKTADIFLKQEGDKVSTQRLSSRQADKAQVTTYQNNIFNADIIQGGIGNQMREMVLCTQQEK